MSKEEESFFAALAEQLNRGATRASLGLLGFRNDALREHLRSLFQNVPGADHSFLSDIVFEAMFGWRPANPNLGELSGKLLHPNLVKALSNPPETLAEEYTFPVQQHPYQHQLQAWQALLAETPPRSVLVTSGTGSGKTECFLVPILNDLATELDSRQGPLVGVRALFLYPLNALIKSQRDRLTAWAEPFGGKIRYCLYNGDTPRESRSEWKSEVADRKNLRANPPPVLVTNATMLEYMLVRTEDQSILNQSQGKLRWIVIDEAHSYMGSQAAELTLLLRRVLHAFGCRAEDVHFVATSATIAGNGSDTTKRLQEFLADIAGVGLERVTVVEGERLVPKLPEISEKKTIPLDLENLRQFSFEERFAALAADQSIRRVRSELARQAQTLSSLANNICGDKSAKSILYTLQLLDLCTKAHDGGNAFLPLRGHFFHRTLNGLWACANPTCSGRIGVKLDTDKWPFGKIFLERRTCCDACRFPVFELVQCGECGEEHLSVLELSQEGNDRLNPYLSVQDEDEFQQDLEPIEEDSQEEVEFSTDILGPGLPRLLVAQPHGNQVGLRPDGLLDWTQQEGIQVNLFGPGEDGELRCPCCRGSNRYGQLFRPVRLSAPFLLQTAIPILLRHLPTHQKAKNILPFDGRRLLSFTDSRQGTARVAVKLQIETERDFVRSLLYHAVADRSRPTNSQDTAQLRAEIAALEPLAGGNPVVQGILEQKRQELAGLDAPPLGRIPWPEAQDRFLSDEMFKRWLLPPLQEQSLGLSERQVTSLCLWREFLSRPKRRFSMEGLGLLRLGYPGIDRINRVPAVAAQLQITVNDWQALAQIAMDYHIRGQMSVAIPDDILRWIGYPGRPSLVIAPGQEKLSPRQRSWPSAITFSRRRSRLVRLLAYALNKDIEQKENQELIEELLIALWGDIHGLLSRTEQGYHLDMSQQVDIVQVREAWLCPVTRRLLPTTFRNVTPYLPDSASKDLAECQKFAMPILPEPFWLGSTPKNVENWLESDERVLLLRSMGVWTDLNDRIASFARYFRSSEHSAQIPGVTLTKRERDFKEGKINLLSCSTTMEMGVDIGGLSAVAMHNAPPNPANFLQRAGRAGRRGETAALSFTLCKSTPHGEAVFHNPLWPFTTALAVPKVSLHSMPIIQRHVNAMTLSSFFAQQAPGDIRRLGAGWFFEKSEIGQSAPWEKFCVWCEADALHVDILCHGVKTLLFRSTMEGKSVSHLLANSINMLGQISRDWLVELQALLENLSIVNTPEGNSAAEKAVGFQMQRIRQEYLLSELTTRGFLPGYGFPGGVVPLVTTTAEEFVRRSRHDKEMREDNRAMRVGYPSRALPIAIRDYSPGTDTVLDGRVYRSDGVTLNWHIPADQEGPSEIQSFRWMWRCETCGGNGARPSKPLICPQCGEKDSVKIRCYEYLQPAGFAVDIRCHPHNDINTPQYIPVRDPMISMEGAEWVALPSPELGRYRVSYQAMIIHRSDGLHGNGYAICLRCGRADSMTSRDELPPTFMDGKGKPVPHKRLRGGKNNDREIECPGSHEPWAIKRSLRLGATTRTEVLELQLHDRVGSPIGRTVAYSLGVILRRALAEKLGIEEREIGVVISPSRDNQGRPTFSVHLFDTAQGGAGYVSQSIYCLPELFRKGQEILRCPRNCDVACQSCLLSYDTQHHMQDLDRHKALELLDENFLHALHLPPTLQAFGPSTVLEMEPLVLALRRERQRIGATEVRIFMGGEVKEWEPFAWRLRNDLLLLHDSLLKIRLVVPQNILAALEPSQRDDLAVLASLIDAEIFSPKTVPVVTGGEVLPRILEIGSDIQSVCWATNKLDALTPTPFWGGNTAGAQFVRGQYDKPLAAIPDKWTPCSIATLRTINANTFMVSITNELDGPLQLFGERAWGVMSKQMPWLKKKLNATLPLVTIMYSDRYLRSPLTFLLLRELINSLSKYSGGTTNDTSISVFTSYLSRFDMSEAQFIHDNWRDRDVRRDIFESALKPRCKLNFIESPNNELPHAREFHLVWQDGAGCTIRLDQGIGYWKTGNGKKTFPFCQSSEKQKDYLNDFELTIEAGSQFHPTFWYLSFSGD